MSKANSRIFVLIGLGVCLLATIPLIFGLVGSTTITTHLANKGFQTPESKHSLLKEKTITTIKLSRQQG